MKKSLFILLSTINIILQSCNTNSENLISGTGTTIVIPELKPDNGSVYLSEFIEKMEFIKLETNTNSLLSGGIQKIIEINDQVIIHDWTPQIGNNTANSSSVCIFDSNGKFIRKIGNSGKGPGEYYQLIKDIALVGNKIVLIENRRLLFYDFNGYFIKYMKPDFKFSYVAINDENNFFFYLNSYGKNNLASPFSKYCIIKCDSTLSDNKSFIKKPKLEMIDPALMVANDYGIFYKGYYNDSILSINNNGKISLTYLLKFQNENKMPLSLLSNNILENERTRKEKNFAKVYSYFDLKDFLVVDIFAANEYVLIFSKKTGKTKLVCLKNIVNDMNEGGVGFRIVGIEKDKNILLSYNQARGIIENSKKPGCKLTDMSKNLTEEDNPIILKYHIKKF